MIGSGSVSSKRLPLLLALCVALFAGFVPLRECLAAGTGEHGVVALGTHAHEHAGPAGVELHIDVECGMSSHDVGHDESDCCIDAPFAAGVRLDVVSADRAVAPSRAVVPSSVAFHSLAVASLDVLTADSARAPAPPTIRTPVPAGVRTVVLLR